MRVLKKNAYDICAGDCATCIERGIKNLSALTICTKRKISTKYVPPDMSAIRLALELNSSGVKDIHDMTDEELARYEAELLDLLEVRSLIQKDTEDDNNGD